MVPGINVARTTLKQIPVLTLSHLTNECIPGLPYSFPVTPYHFFIVSYPLLVLLYPEYLTYSLIQNIWLYYIYTTIYERNMQILIRTMYLHFIHVLYRIQSVSELFGIFIQLRFLCNNIHKNPNTLKYVHT